MHRNLILMRISTIMLLLNSIWAKRPEPFLELRNTDTVINPLGTKLLLLIHNQRYLPPHNHV